MDSPQTLSWAEGTACHAMKAETEGMFYNVSNLPLADQKDWERRMIYRVFLRSPYPPAIWQTETSYSLHLGLVNEMSLFPRKAMQEGERLECFVQALCATRPEREIEGVEVEVKALDQSQLRWTTIPDLSWPGFCGGKGAISIVLKTAHLGPCDLLLKIGIKSATPGRSLHVMPLIVGPFSLVQGSNTRLTGEEMLFFHRQVSSQRSSIIIRESPEIAIPGKIWDSALFASNAATDLLRGASEDSQTPVVVDLSSGTGICGIWLASTISKQYKSAKIILTDLPEAIPVMKTNVALNKHLFASEVTVDIHNLQWGAPIYDYGFPELDLIIACDLIYEAELLPDLVSTLDLLSTVNKTQIIVGYKQRGLTKQEKEHLWEAFDRIFDVERLPSIEGCLQPTCWSDEVGVELWKLCKI